MVTDTSCPPTATTQHRLLPLSLLLHRHSLQQHRVLHQPTWTRPNLSCATIRPHCLMYSSLHAICCCHSPSLQVQQAGSARNHFHVGIRPVEELQNLPQGTLLSCGLCYHCGILLCCLWPLGVALAATTSSFGRPFCYRKPVNFPAVGLPGEFLRGFRVLGWG